jgi:hypothetical protein
VPADRPTLGGLIAFVRFVDYSAGHVGFNSPVLESGLVFGFCDRDDLGATCLWDVIGRGQSEKRREQCSYFSGGEGARAPSFFTRQRFCCGTGGNCVGRRRVDCRRGSVENS